ncbi:hypothetical protein L1987_76070 [Smallanthus sonchifolius]|uniref:Uncharacterized protein n=1 Tax=Smallanthus sonchifolius TaxID=185202 RepID=A0ACB9A7U1_9ASTR|nr:hypothetical protein L1987_76070 [Smallanthus sonchifolius]
MTTLERDIKAGKEGLLISSSFLTFQFPIQSTMRREWLCKASGGVDGGGGGGKSPSATKPLNGRKSKDKNKNSSSSGCMSVIFNLFDIQHHQFRFHHPSFMTDHQGIEAQRSSLESPESAVEGRPSSSKVKEETNLNIPVGRIQIKTKRSRFTDDISSECSNSPGTKTPNLVARLMGLDLLPEYSSPRPSSSSTPANSHHHTRSLPATPRISTASRRSTDNDYHHRLSLQIDKENCNNCRRRSEIPANRQEDDLKTQYAKQITNQVRERISRRLGTDITNTISLAVTLDRRDSDLVLLKPKKSPAVKSKPDDSTQLVSSSPKLRLLDIKSNLNKPISNSHPLLVKEVKSKSKSKSKSLTAKVKPPEKPVKEDVFVSKKKKKSTELQNHVLNVKNTRKFHSFKKEMMTSSSSTARSSQLQVSLPSCLNSPYKPVDTHKLKPPTTTTSAADTSSFSDHFDYISKILNNCGINSTTPISLGQWHSHSHPLHPSIFHQIENLLHPAAVATRRMIFDLADESLVEILNQKPDSCIVYGSDLIKKLCDRIGGFPAAHCEVLDDIDGLVEADMGGSTRRLVAMAVEVEGEDIVKEIESEIVESLVHEIATEMVAPARSDRVRLPVLVT